jgi:hypothetical protein
MTLQTIYLKQKKNFVFICGPSNVKIPCKLEINFQSEPTLLIGRRWTSYCHANAIVNGEILKFYCAYNMTTNCIIVKKM